MEKPRPQRHVILAGLVGLLIGGGSAVASLESPVEPRVVGSLLLLASMAATLILYYAYIFVGRLRPGWGVLLESLISTLLASLVAAAVIYDMLA
ncbi:MAG: hypothetical protein F7B18_02870 [Desulfurococcales archaeon]|nr:hypothetical protein [Desulfurococcales archaeon]